MEVGSAFEAVEQQTECTGPDSATQRVVVAYQDVDVDEPGGRSVKPAAITSTPSGCDQQRYPTGLPSATIRACVSAGRPRNA